MTNEQGQFFGKALQRIMLPNGHDSKYGLTIGLKEVISLPEAIWSIMGVVKLAH